MVNNVDPVAAISGAAPPEFVNFTNSANVYNALRFALGKFH